MSWKVGQVAFFEASFHDRGPSGEVTITKVGTKYVYTSNGHRFFAENGVVDGGQYSSPGKVFPSKEVYEEHRLREDLWIAITSNINRAGIANLSIADLREIGNKIYGEDVFTSHLNRTSDFRKRNRYD